VQRLVTTSAGACAFDFNLSPGGLMIWITAFDSEGWESGRATWHDDGSASFEEVIAEVVRVPTEEAARVAEACMGEWRARERQEVATREWRRIKAVLFAVFGLAAAGVAALVWLVVTLLA
jgi:hypothetical protein